MTTIYSVAVLAEMSKAQLLAVWHAQDRQSYCECLLPKTKSGLIQSIVAFQSK